MITQIVCVLHICNIIVHVIFEIEQALDTQTSPCPLTVECFYGRKKNVEAL